MNNPVPHISNFVEGVTYYRVRTQEITYGEVPEILEWLAEHTHTCISLDATVKWYQDQEFSVRCGRLGRDVSLDLFLSVPVTLTFWFTSLTEATHSKLRWG